MDINQRSQISYYITLYNGIDNHDVAHKEAVSLFLTATISWVLSFCVTCVKHCDCDNKLCYGVLRLIRFAMLTHCAILQSHFNAVIIATTNWATILWVLWHHTDESVPLLLVNWEFSSVGSVQVPVNNTCGNKLEHTMCSFLPAFCFSSSSLVMWLLKIMPKHEENADSAHIMMNICQISYHGYFNHRQNLNTPKFNLDSPKVRVQVRVHNTSELSFEIEIWLLNDPKLLATWGRSCSLPHWIITL